MSVGFNPIRVLLLLWHYAVFMNASVRVFTYRLAPSVYDQSLTSVAMLGSLMTFLSVVAMNHKFLKFQIWKEVFLLGLIMIGASFDISLDIKRSVEFVVTLYISPAICSLLSMVGLIYLTDYSILISKRAK